MVDKNTDFFKISDNFAKTAKVRSVQIIQSDLGFTPKVTIAIPTYKRADLLKETIDSAINQVGYDDYDIIVVDNDQERNCETEKLMLSFNNKRISYYKNSENIGMAGNWNRLFELAKGEYVVMLHDDDLILVNFLNVLSTILHKNIDVLLSNLQIFDARSSSNEFIISKRNYKSFYRYGYIDFFFNNHSGPPTGTCFKKSFFLKLKGFSHLEYPTLDLHFFLKATFYGKVYKLMSPNLVLYRILVNESQNLNTLEGFVCNNFQYRLFYRDTFKSLFLKRILFSIICTITIFDIDHLSTYYNVDLKHLKEKLEINDSFSLFFYRIIRLSYRLFYYYPKRVFGFYF